MNKTGYPIKQQDKKKSPVTEKEVTLQDCLQTLLLSLFIVKFYVA